MLSVAVVGAVALEMPAFAEHSVNEVHEVLIVENIVIFSLFEFESWMLVAIHYSLS